MRDEDPTPRETINPDDIDWAFLGVAVRMKLKDMRDAETIKAQVKKTAMQIANVTEGAMNRAIQGGQLSPTNLHRICGLLGRDAKEFLKDEKRDAVRAKVEKLT